MLSSLKLGIDFLKQSIQGWLESEVWEFWHCDMCCISFFAVNSLRFQIWWGVGSGRGSASLTEQRGEMNPAAPSRVPLEQADGWGLDWWWQPGAAKQPRLCSGAALQAVAMAPPRPWEPFMTRSLCCSMTTRLTWSPQWILLAVHLLYAEHPSMDVLSFKV